MRSLSDVYLLCSILVTKLFITTGSLTNATSNELPHTINFLTYSVSSQPDYDVQNEDIAYPRLYFSSDRLRKRTDFHRNSILTYHKRNYAPPSIDDVVYVARHEMGRFPYNSVVRLSAGCTGTLVTPEHVLTAAHCVHDGFAFKDNMEMLKVEVPNRVGYRIHYIVKIHIPFRWMKIHFTPDFYRSAHDYAILQLELPVAGLNNFMELAIATSRSINSNLQFLGFESGPPAMLRLSRCYSHGNHVLLGGNIALRQCESTNGNSGAAVYTDRILEGPRIVGVLSNALSGAGSGDISVETITLLTPDKCRDICSMIHPLGESYHVCNAGNSAGGRRYTRRPADRITHLF